MDKRWMPVLILVLALAGGVAADAQDTPRAGLVMGYPASVGVICHVTDAFALRPELSLTKSSSDFSAPSFVSQSTDSWAVGVGVSGLFYIGRWDNLRTYVSPRFAYGKTTTHGQTAGGLSAINLETSASTYSTTGSFGAQYSLANRFGLFGEIGLNYSRQSADSSGSGSQGHSNTWSTRSGVGVIVYF